jgi:hypothetical protein
LGQGLKKWISDFWVSDLFPPRKGIDDPISNNAKLVLYGLFFLIGITILTYGIIVMEKYGDDQEKGNQIPLNDSQKVELLQELEQVNTVYIAAISGALALGGTLVARLWGRGTT